MTSKEKKCGLERLVCCERTSYKASICLGHHSRMSYAQFNVFGQWAWKGFGKQKIALFEIIIIIGPFNGKKSQNDTRIAMDTTQKIE